MTGRGVAVEVGDGCGFVIGARRPADNAAILVSWPDKGRHSRFVSKACCSNVIEIGIEVY